MLKELEYWNHNTVYYNWIKKQLKQSNCILDIGCGDGLLNLGDVRKVISEELPGCEFRMGLYYRYLLRWEKFAGV